jgi:hypothetical protein
MAFFVGIVFGVIYVISEIRGRQQLERMLASRITSLREDVANSKAPCLDKDGNMQILPGQDERDLIEEFDRHRSLLQTLSTSGVQRTADSFPEIRNNVQHVLRNGADKSATTAGESSGDIPWYYFITRCSSDLLLSWVVIFSGTIGAVIAAIRKQRELGLHPRDLAFGFAAGFITVLAIRGGKNVMVIQIADVSFTLNPYASAFLGLMAGLFTEKAYLLLRKFVDKLVDGVEKTFNLNEVNGDPGPAGPGSADDESKPPEKTPPDGKPSEKITVPLGVDEPGPDAAGDRDES